MALLFTSIKQGNRIEKEIGGLKYSRLYEFNGFNKIPLIWVLARRLIL